MCQLLNKLTAYALVYRLWNDAPEEPGDYIHEYMQLLRTKAIEYIGVAGYSPAILIRRVEEIALDDYFTADNSIQKVQLLLGEEHIKKTKRTLS